MPEIFINYRTGDCEQAAAHIERYLSDRFGDRCTFRASKSIRPGDNYKHHLQNASSGSRALLALIGPGWLDAADRDGNRALENKNDWTRREILNARRSGARIIPILVGRRTERLDAKKLPKALAFLADLQSLVYDTGNDQASLKQIAEELVDLVPGLSDPKPEQAPTTSPVYNINHGQVNGDMVQAGQINGGSVVNQFGRVNGPVHTGSGNQQVFTGDRTNYIAGPQFGGIQQNVGTGLEDDR
ncbi:hypothetical protein GCM10011581_34100 [Saccharopolyspora subtropica]|uniref:TIR domain-containing protein n=1 Tax=Saccharopolyspora thermophila TaxID=89367 RepID=A0A917JZK2_9PSEU|nr:toll/interleukin-1 receptor domain-containing protein [Saccharopolyspora subtropica]GGI94159.1 hypothetical protein GCM10011581_34100 [Saccharopolyspora subtropica]